MFRGCRCVLFDDFSVGTEATALEALAEAKSLLAEFMHDATLRMPHLSMDELHGDVGEWGNGGGLSKQEAASRVCLQAIGATARLLAVRRALRDPERVASLFHEMYEAIAPAFGYETRDDSAVAWEDVPDRNKGLMIETARCVGLVLLEEAA